MRVYTIHYLCIFLLLFLLLLLPLLRLLLLILLSSSWGRLPYLAGGVDCFFGRGSRPFFTGDVGCLFGRIFSAWWWYCVHCEDCCGGVYVICHCPNQGWESTHRLHLYPLGGVIYSPWQRTPGRGASILCLFWRTIESLGGVLRKFWRGVRLRFSIVYPWLMKFWSKTYHWLMSISWSWAPFLHDFKKFQPQQELLRDIFRKQTLI